MLMKCESDEILKYESGEILKYESDEILKCESDKILIYRFYIKLFPFDINDIKNCLWCESCLSPSKTEVTSFFCEIFWE